MIFYIKIFNIKIFIKKYYSNCRNETSMSDPKTMASQISNSSYNNDDDEIPVDINYDEEEEDEDQDHHPRRHNNYHHTSHNHHHNNTNDDRKSKSIGDIGAIPQLKVLGDKNLKRKYDG